MYKHSIWDEEQERYDNIITDREENRLEYHHQRDYAAGGTTSSDVYNTERAEEERKEEETGIGKDIKEEDKKYERKEEVTEKGIKMKAASVIQEEGKKENRESQKKRKEYKSIEDAVNKAMKEEKEVIYVDD